MAAAKDEAAAPPAGCEAIRSAPPATSGCRVPTTDSPWEQSSVARRRFGRPGSPQRSMPHRRSTWQSGIQPSVTKDDGVAECVNRFSRVEVGKDRIALPDAFFDEAALVEDAL